MKFTDDTGAEYEDCWLWAYRVDDKDYGQLAVWTGEKAIKYKAHRAVYEALVGPIPEGLTLDHLCRVRRCVNPAHMEPVTSRENTMRGLGPASINARKTHCKRGHYLSGTNLRTYKDTGYRQCLACAKAARQVRYALNKGSDD